MYGGRAARGPASRVATFVEALRVELDLRADSLDVRFGLPGDVVAGRPPLDSVYLGGGTPSLLPGATLASLLDQVARRYGLRSDAEVTLEVNPGPDERGDAREQRAAGVTRLSIGAQSFQPGELATLGRRHTPTDIAAAVVAGRAAGMDSISVDLLYDVPGQTAASWGRSLDAVLALDPDHLSLYALTLDGTDAPGPTGPSDDHLPVRRGARRWRERAAAAQDEDRAAAMYELADDRLAAAGYAWYEISNWARPGHPSRHNLGYWRGRAWEAVGPGAHAFDGRVRRWNAAPLDGYVTALRPPGGAPRLPPGGTDGGTDLGADGNGARSAGEQAMLALRTSDGLADGVASGRVADGLRWAAANGLAEHLDARWILTRRGRLLSNEVFERLL